MKLLKKVMYGMSFLLAGCQAEELFEDGAVAPGDGNVTFTVSAPEAMPESRAVLGENSNSALGGVTNVNTEEYDLRYQLAVYRVENGDYVEAVSPQMKIVDKYEPVTYSLRLTPNRNYQVVVWADFVREGETEDLHYNTSDFRNIHVPELPDKYVLNDESKDAYFTTVNVPVENDAVSEDLVLKRPFAKVRVVTTDWNYGNLEMPDNFKVTYYGCKRFVNLDPVLGVSSYDKLGDAGLSGFTATIDKAEKDYAQGYDASEGNRTVIVDYLMTDLEEQTPIHMTIEALDGETLIASHDLSTDIPIQRNWLTTIIGNVLTTGSEFNITIDEGFENEWTVGELWWKSSGVTPKEPAYDAATKTYKVYTKEEFMWLPDHIDEMRTNAGGNFTLSIENDIDMSGVNWKPIYPGGSAREYTVEGNGHTLRNFTIDGEFGAIYEYSALGGLIKRKYNAYTGIWGKFDGLMKDITFENISINGLANDEVHTDVDGNPIDHSKEYAYFAGVVGYTGGNQWSMSSKFENVHVKHMHIQSSASSQNLGGLVGWVGSGGGGVGNRSVSFKNCTATDIHLRGYQAGGLVGQILGDRGAQFENCSTEDIYIRYHSISQSSGFIGNIGDGGLTISFYAAIEINNCTPATHVEYIRDSTGEKLDYTPQSPYYGHKNDGDVVTITPAETTEP